MKAAILLLVVLNACDAGANLAMLFGVLRRVYGKSSCHRAGAGTRSDAAFLKFKMERPGSLGLSTALRPRCITLCVRPRRQNGERPAAADIAGLSVPFCLAIPHIIMAHQCIRFAWSSEVWSRPWTLACALVIGLGMAASFVTGELGTVLTALQVGKPATATTLNLYAFWVSIAFLASAVRRTGPWASVTSS